MGTNKFIWERDMGTNLTMTVFVGKIFLYRVYKRLHMLVYKIHTDCVYVGRPKLYVHIYGLLR